MQIKAPTKLQQVIHRQAYQLKWQASGRLLELGMHHHVNLVPISHCCVTSGACCWRPVQAQCATAWPTRLNCIICTHLTINRNCSSRSLTASLYDRRFTRSPACPAAVHVPFPSSLPLPPSPQRHTDAILQDQELRTILQGLEAHALYGEDGLPRINYDGFSQVGGRCWEARDVGRLQRYFRRGVAHSRGILQHNLQRENCTCTSQAPACSMAFSGCVVQLCRAG